MVRHTRSLAAGFCRALGMFLCRALGPDRQGWLHPVGGSKNLGHVNCSEVTTPQSPHTAETDVGYPGQKGTTRVYGVSSH